MDADERQRLRREAEFLIEDSRKLYQDMEDEAAALKRGILDGTAAKYEVGDLQRKLYKETAGESGEN